METANNILKKSTDYQVNLESVVAWKRDRLEALEKEILDRKHQQKRQLMRKLKGIKKELHFLEDAYKGESALCETLRSELKDVENQLSHFCIEINKNQLKGRVEKDCQRWLRNGCKENGDQESHLPIQKGEVKGPVALMNFIPLLIFLMFLLILSFIGH